MKWSTHQATSVLHGYPGSLSAPMPRIPSGVSHSLVPASGCRSASLGRSPNSWGDTRLLKGAGAVRVPMSRPDTAGSLGLCLSRPGLHIYPQLLVHGSSGVCSQHCCWLGCLMAGHVYKHIFLCRLSVCSSQFLLYIRNYCPGVKR